MEVKNEKKVLVLSFLGVITFIAVVVGATYAYFAAQGGGTGNINVNANTATTDNLSFQAGEAISLTANQEDFGQGAGNKRGSTFARATLTANNATNNATRDYYVYLNIESNDFEYTTEEEKAEILLKVIDPKGMELTTLGSLERKTSGGETWFDITTKTGSITIADNYEITSTGTETQEWQLEVIFANLDSDQNANTGKSFSANLIIREDSPIGITVVSASNVTSDSIILTVNAESENTITNYYFAKNEEEYVSSASNTYTFTGLDAATEYTLKAYAVDSEGYQSAVYSTDVTTAELTLADICREENSNTLACKVATTYTTDGENGLYYHDGTGSYTNSNFEAGDNSYRYAGANPNNYVCFGSDEEVCPEDNLYKIIGVFDKVKLIKNTSIGGYAWDADSVNTWDASTKPDIYTTLNETYYNTLGSEWQNLISESTWQVGGMVFDRQSIARFYYDYEVGTRQRGYEETMKIGLMYVSDYGYGANPEKWTTGLFSENYGMNNWLQLDNGGWLISRFTVYSYSAFFVVPSSGGYIYYDDVRVANAVHPSFYLVSTATISSGTGTSTDPFILNLG